MFLRQFLPKNKKPKESPMMKRVSPKTQSKVIFIVAAVAATASILVFLAKKIIKQPSSPEDYPI
jgi:hypothetical protein